MVGSREKLGNMARFLKVMFPFPRPLSTFAMIAFYAYLKRKKRMDKALRQVEGEAGFGGPSR